MSTILFEIASLNQKMALKVKSFTYRVSTTSRLLHHVNALVIAAVSDLFEAINNPCSSHGIAVLQLRRSCWTVSRMDNVQNFAGIERQPIKVGINSRLVSWDHLVEFTTHWSAHLADLGKQMQLLCSYKFFMLFKLRAIHVKQTSTRERKPKADPSERPKSKSNTHNISGE